MATEDNETNESYPRENSFGISSQQRNRAILEDADCFQKARERGEQTFTLVERDITSPRTIAFWIMENIDHASPEKLRDAMNDALAMRFSVIPKRYAD